MAAGSDRLQRGERLVASQSQSLKSADGRWTLIMQPDGNLVTYLTENLQPVWASGTVRSDVMYVIFQYDGNLVIYNQGETPVWASQSANKNGMVLILQNDSNVVIYDGNATPIWASGSVHG